MPDRVKNADLVEAGLTLMRRKGAVLKRVQTSSRAMIYELADGSTVRVRTCNDHVLVVLAESAEEDAKLNIQGTDHLLIVMPVVPRTTGEIVAYFLPTDVVISAARKVHADWLASNPATKGNNRTWNIWFSDDAAKSGGFARTWSKYQLPGTASTNARQVVQLESQTGNLGAVIADARRRIAEAAGVPMDCVKISVALG